MTARTPHPQDPSPERAVRAVEALTSEVRALRSQLRDLETTVRTLVDQAKRSAFGATAAGVLGKLFGGK